MATWASGPTSAHIPRWGEAPYPEPLPRFGQSYRNCYQFRSGSRSGSETSRILIVHLIVRGSLYVAHVGQLTEINVGLPRRKRKVTPAAECSGPIARSHAKLSAETYALYCDNEHKNKCVPK